LPKGDKYVEEAKREVVASNAFTFPAVLGSTTHPLNDYYSILLEPISYH